MNREIALEWLKAAHDDLRLTAAIIADAGLTHLAAFHCHQAIEKSFKAALEYNGCKVPRKHDLLMLKDLLPVELPIEDEMVLETLNSLYIDARYPGTLGLLPNGKPAVQDARKFYAFAMEIYDCITKQISGCDCDQ